MRKSLSLPCYGRYRTQQQTEIILTANRIAYQYMSLDENLPSSDAVYIQPPNSIIASEMSEHALWLANNMTPFY